MLNGLKNVTFDSSGFSAEGTLTCTFGVHHCGLYVRVHHRGLSFMESVCFSGSLTLSCLFPRLSNSKLPSNMSTSATILPPEMNRIDTRSQYEGRRFSICRSKIQIFGFYQNWMLQAFFCAKTLFLMLKCDVL